MEWGFWEILSVILIPLYSLVLCIGVAPFVYILGRESAKFVCRATSNLFVSNNTASFRLAMLAAQLHADQWRVENRSRIYHPQVGYVYMDKDGCCAGDQQITAAQYWRIYDRVVDEKAMIRLRAMNDEATKQMRQLRA